MKKMFLIYIIYLIVIISVTIYISFTIINGNFWTESKLLGWFIKGKEFQVYPLPNIEKESKSINCTPCKKVGEEPPNCPLYDLYPNFEQVYDGNWICLPATKIKINSIGFRDYEYPFSKSSNIFRIIALGDSHTFGLGVEFNETYPKILEKMLNERNDGWKYEVLNFGIVGADMLDKVAFFKKSLSFSPDLVILQFVSDDVINAREIEGYVREYRENYNLSSNEITNQKLYDNLSENYFKLLFSDEKKFSDLWKDRIEKPLMELVKITSERKIKVLILFSFSDNRDFVLIEKLVHDNDWYLVDGQKYYNSEYRLNEKDSHLNALGYRLLAESIYYGLVANNLLPQKLV